MISSHSKTFCDTSTLLTIKQIKKFNNWNHHQKFLTREQIKKRVTANFKRHGTADNIRDFPENICKDSEKSSNSFMVKNCTTIRTVGKMICSPVTLKLAVTG